MKLPKNPSTPLDFTRREVRAIQYVRAAGGYPINGQYLVRVGVLDDVVAICMDTRHEVPVFSWTDRFGRSVEHAFLNPENFHFSFKPHSTREQAIRRRAHALSFDLNDFRGKLYAAGWRPMWKWRPSWKR